MPLNETLKKVEEDIRTGDLGKARARLHGLIASYPNNLDLRKQLGDIYWNLHMPAMAGRYWYLVEDKDERMQAARKRFEGEFRNDPYHMLLALKFKGDREAMKGTYADDVLDDLEHYASKKYPWYADFGKKGLETKQHLTGVTRPRKVHDFFFGLGCLIVFALVISLAFVGLFTTITAVVKWLQ